MPLMRIMKIVTALVVLFLCASLLAVYNLNQRTRENLHLSAKSRIFMELTHELVESSRQLTQAVRLYVITKNPDYEKKFWNIVKQRSGEIPRSEDCSIDPGVSASLISMLQKYAPSQNDYAIVRRAFLLSEKLVEIENQAIDATKGIQRKDGAVIQGIPDWDHARYLVFSPVYLNWQQEILQPLHISLQQVREKINNYDYSKYKNIIASTAISLIILSIILLSLFIFIYYIRKNHITQLINIISFADNINKGLFNIRCSITGHTVIDKLAQAFNTLLDNLEKEKNISNTDALTQLHNRRYYDMQLQEFRKDQEDDYIVFSLLSLDIDFFKKINDTFGHVYGDEVLKSFALILKECSRSEDLVARVGGEEFVILAHGDSSQVAQLAERIRRSVEERLILPDGRAVTCSIGIAQYRNGMELAVLQGNADNALYQAKQNGRNRVCIFQFM